MSIWLGPPTMNRKMTDFAFAGKVRRLRRERIHALPPLAARISSDAKRDASRSRAPRAPERRGA